MTTQQRFTPTHSPIPSASLASPTSSIAADEEHLDRETGEDLSRLRRPPLPSSTAGSSSHTPDALTALHGWTAHQSHGQLTILFYVPRWTPREELEITIQHDQVIAGIQGQAPILKARLSGRIDPHTSNWRLEKRSVSKRTRSRSRTRTRTRARSSEHGSSSGAESGEHGGISATAGTRTAPVPPVADQQSRDRLAQVAGRQRPRSMVSHDGSRPISPVQSEASSFELLSRSTDTFASRPSRLSGEIGSPANLSSPHSLSQSMTLSEGSGAFIHPPTHSSASSSQGDGGIRSMESSVSIDRSVAPSSDGSRATNDLHDDPIRDAKLVTLHLDKVDGGIWPCIVSGAIASNRDGDREDLSPRLPFLAHSAFARPGRTLEAALGQALGDTSVRLPRQRDRSTSGSSHNQGPSSGTRDASEPGSRSSVEITSMDDSMADHSINYSTSTIDTIGSDDSTTVLGSGTDRGREEELYNMDPTSLTLIGMQYARRSSTIPFGSIMARHESHAFECFRRAWRAAGIPTAIEHLVHHYLPLQPRSDSAQANAVRQRLMAALGGPKALAKLYISYAHLQLPSYQHEQPLLVLPQSGTSNNPFGVQSVHLYAASNQSDPENGEATALDYLREAYRLDATVDIAQVDWHEAHRLEQEFGTTTRSNRSEAASPSSRSEAMFESDASGVTHGSGHDNANAIQRRTRRRKAGGTRRRKLNRHHSGSTGDPGLVHLVVSRAVLLSIVVAGGMAVAGWWRRASTGAGAA